MTFKVCPETRTKATSFVVDRRWNLLRANTAGQRFVGFLTDSPPRPPDPAQPVNLADALVAPNALRPLIANWRDVVLYFIRSMRADAMADGNPETSALLDRLLAYPDVPALWEMLSPEDMQQLVLAMHFVKGTTSLRLFTMLATLGTANDITAQEIRIESFFPADAATEAVFRQWAAEHQSSWS